MKMIDRTCQFPVFCIMAMWWLLTTVATSVPVGAQVQSSPKLSETLALMPLEAIAERARREGDPMRGAVAFYEPSMNCARCHQATAERRQLGPNLAEKRELDWRHLTESVLHPSAKIKQGFETVQIALASGQVVTGVLVENDGKQLVIDQIEQAAGPRSFDLDDIDDWAMSDVSTMPEGLTNQLANSQQFFDLVSYLAALAAEGTVAESRYRPITAELVPLAEYESHVDHAGLITSLDDQSLQRGAETFRLRCASCHGTLAEEGSMPTSLRFQTGQFKQGGDPLSMYRTLTHGFGMMNPQRWMVPQQKYEVIHYIREHFVRPHNPQAYVEVTEDYLASLPAGDTRGPEPQLARPWTAMDYGPSLNNTIEVSKDGSNIAQKGIVIRLDQGPGGVESGQHWMMYEHDTLRVAGAWRGSFIDYEGIHFNGAHNRHPSVTGEIQFSNPTGPGFARPNPSGSDSLESRFQDDRVVGRDGRHYGPLPGEWGKFLGLYRFGTQTILKYRIGQTEILETPGVTFSDDRPVYTRILNLGPRQEDIVMQVAHVAGVFKSDGSTASVLPPSRSVAAPNGQDRDDQGIVFDGNQYYQLDAAKFNLATAPFSIYARIQTKQDGTLFAKTRDQENWVPGGKAFFIRGGKPTFDIGWVGAVSANRRVDDGKWHDVALVWNAGKVQFFVDGQAAGGGSLGSVESLDRSVIRIGKTNQNFPGQSAFSGKVADIRFYQRPLSIEELKHASGMDDRELVAHWNQVSDHRLPVVSGDSTLTAEVHGPSAPAAPSGLVATVQGIPAARFEYQQGQLRLVIPAGAAGQLIIAHCGIDDPAQGASVSPTMRKLEPRDLSPLTRGGPALFPETLVTMLTRGPEGSAFAVDVMQRPTSNPWNCQLRLTGIDFLPDGQTAVVTAWDGSVWTVSGFSELPAGSNTPQKESPLQWRRFACGLFQPLGVKVVQGKVHVICRDQIVILHDLNHDGEADWYQNFNSDHQVTEHFHEFAAGLQIDEDQNFYYAKCARHALPAIVPQHGTLLKVSADGLHTEIVATGFRAPNGVCLNGDGTFFLTDQEGHWTPKNRINRVVSGGFYGNVLGYHEGVDASDDAMEPPVCWITNEFDRSPSELIWVTSDRWKPLQGSLLNLSYGYGQIYVVPHETVNGQTQGGMARLPLPRFPTGIMRGRFHPDDGQLYCCGMFAWAGNQQQPGGLYRVRYTGGPVYLPVGLAARVGELEITFSDPIDPQSASLPDNYNLEVWDLTRSANYGSEHLNQRQLKVDHAVVSDDRKRVTLLVPELAPTRGMKVEYSIKTAAGEPLKNEIHNSIHQLGKSRVAADPGSR